MNPLHSIVVCDPEPNRCETKCALLRDAGWTVNSALTAAHTHGHVAQGGISLLVLHTTVAGDDGTDLCRKIKETNPDILVLHTAPEAYDSCADGYLREPGCEKPARRWRSAPSTWHSPRRQPVSPSSIGTSAPTGLCGRRN